jgi:hypothetical protein
MTWKLTGYGRTRYPLPGVPWRDLSDAEMAAAEEAHPGIGERGYFEQEPEPPAPAATTFTRPVPRRGGRS